MTTKSGSVRISTTFRNTLVIIVDDKGKAIAWASSGGHSGNLRHYVANDAQKAAATAAKKAVEQGMKEVEVWVKGPGAGREAALRALQEAGLEITLIKDMTPIPHNGCRKPVFHRMRNNP